MLSSIGCSDGGGGGGNSSGPVPILSLTSSTLTFDEDFATVQLIVTATNASEITVNPTSTDLIIVEATSNTVNVSSVLNANGQTTLTITASNGGNSVSTDVLVIVNAINDAPTLSVSNTALTLFEDFAPTASITLSTNDVEGNTLTISVAQSTSGVVNAVATPNAIDLTSIANANGRTTLTITVSDGALSASARVGVVVNGVVDTPTISIQIANLNENEDFFGFRTVATIINVDTDTLTVSVTQSTPEVVTVTTSDSGVRVSNIAHANGQTTLTISANNRGIQVSTQVNVVVNAVNDTPTLTIATSLLTFSEDLVVASTIATFTDIDGDTLTISVTQSTPEVVTVTTAASGVRVSNLANANGRSTLTIRVNDGTINTSTQIVVVVSSVNDTPILSVSTNDITLTEDFTTTIPITVTATDTDGDTPTISVIQSTLGVVTAVATSNAVNVSSILNAYGRTTLTISLSDGTTSTSTQVAVTVTPLNDPPTLAVSINRLVLIEDFINVVPISVIRGDIDGDTLTLSVTESTAGVVNATTTTAGVNVSRIDNANGRTTLTINIFDGTINVSTEVVVIVDEVNDTPILSVSKNALALTEDFVTTETIVIMTSDIDNDTLTISLTQSTLGVVTAVATSNAVNVSSILNVNGRTTLMISLSDGTTSTSTQVAVTVNAVNDTPTVSIFANPLTLNEDFADETTIAIVTDVENNTLTFSVIESTTGVIKVTTSTSEVRISSIANANGQTTLTITVIDGAINVSTQVAVTIISVNDTPTFNVSTTVLKFNEDFETLVPIDVPRNDVDGDTLILSFTESTTGIVSVTTSVTGLRVSSIANANGRTTLTVNINDGTTNVSTQVTVTVNAINDTPTFTLSTTRLTFSEDFATTILITVSANDIEDDTLTISVVEFIQGVVNAVRTTTGIEVSSVANANGVTVLTILVNDGLSTASNPVSVSVISVNDTPTLIVPTTTLTFTEDFAGISTIATATDVDRTDLVTFSVIQSTPVVVVVTTSAAGVRISNLSNAHGRTTLTITASDRSLKTSTEVIVFVSSVNDTPTVSVSPTVINLNEDFTTTEIIVVTIRDIDSSTLTYNVTESMSGVVKVTTSSSEIRITSIKNANGQTTLIITVSDGSLSSTAVVPVTINAVNDPILLSLSSSAVTLSALGNQLDRIVQDISISNVDKVGLSIQILSSGSAIFSTNPTPVASFTTNVLTTITTQSSVVSTAQLYFSIAPNQTGTATLTVHLSSPSRPDTTQQTMVVQVIPVDAPPVIIKNSTNIENFVVYGGHLYANSAVLERPIAPFLVEAQGFGGYLININTIEELNFVVSAASGLTSQNAWFGMVVPNITFPGELFWVTNDSTIAYGFAIANAGNNPTVYPGHYALPWNFGNGLVANRGSSRPFSTSNWLVYSRITNTFFLLGNSGDTTLRHALYEFPNGIAPVPLKSITIGEGTTIIARLTGFDLNGDTINTSDWSGVDHSSGTVNIRSVAQRSGAQTVDVEYVTPLNFSGETTVVITLQLNGSSVSATIPLKVDEFPVLVLSTNAITLAEDFSPVVIGTTATDIGVTGALPFTVRASISGIVNITTSANTIHLSAVPNVSGTLTLTIQATDSAPQTVSTLVVVTVQAVNDTPTINVSTDDITTLGGFVPINIDVTILDVENNFSSLSITLQDSNPGVINASRIGNMIVVSPIRTGVGRTTLTLSATDLGNKTGIQTIAFNVLVRPSTTPVLTVSTNNVVLHEDFADFLINTTETDDTPESLSVTVSAFNSVINAVISAGKITLRSINNVFGQATLTVRLTDQDGLFDLEEIVVDVLPMNDTPVITVSSAVVYVESTPVILTVSADDVENGSLPFSFSTNHNQINTILNNSELTITRLGLPIAQYMLTFNTIDLDGLRSSTIVTVVLPPITVLSTGIKTINFNWSSIPSASYYYLQSNIDRVSGFVDLTTTGVVVSPNSTNIRQTTAHANVALHRYIPKANNPQYGVGTCDTTSCGTSFRHTVADLTNVELNSLIGRLEASNSVGSSQFGESVSLSSDGNTLAVGAIGDDSSSTGINSVPTNNDSNSGAVYIFRRNGSIWTQQAYIKASNADRNDNFGRSVSLSADGNTFAVGVPFENSILTGINGAQDDNSGSFVGAVYLFRFNASSDSWSQQAYIKASNADIPDSFGLSVSISDDGNTLAVGAPLESGSSVGINGMQNDNSSTFSGAAYIFRFSTSTDAWFQQAYIKASNTGGGDNFGFSVSLSSDGNTLAVSAESEDGLSNNVSGSGAAYVFRSDGSNWSQQAYIKATNAGVGDGFGISLSLNDNGNTLAVGAPNEGSSSTGINSVPNNNTTNTGAVYVFQFNSSGVWTQQAYIKASNPDEEDKFGGSVSLSKDGNSLVVGAINEDGSAIGIEGINDNARDNAGAAYVFEFRNGNWVQQAYIKSIDSSVNDHFGSSVSISNNGDTVVVGAKDVGGNEGQVNLY